MADKIIDQQAPLVLVKTWIGLVTSKEADLEVKARALTMLREKVGSPKEIEAYMIKHNIN